MAKLVTGICWGVVIVTWIVGAVYGMRRSRGQHRGSRGAALLQVGAFVAAFVVFRFIIWGDLGAVTDHSWWIALPGLVLLVASTGFAVWARLSLGRMWSASPDMLQTHHELRTDGPYAITRHPIYTGLLGMLLGTVLVNGFGITLAALGFGAVFLAVRIPIEEQLMSTTFPDDYAHYRERVPRLVPGLHLLRRLH